MGCVSLDLYTPTANRSDLYYDGVHLSQEGYIFFGAADLRFDFQGYPRGADHGKHRNINEKAGLSQFCFDSAPLLYFYVKLRKTQYVLTFS